MSPKKIRSPFGDVPNPFGVHEGFFSDMEEAKYAIRGVLRAYFGNAEEDEEDYLFFKASVVRFESDPRVDLELDHRRRVIIFVLKEPLGENADVLKLQIRQQITMQFAVLASDARGRTAMSIYRALDQDAKTAILESEKKKESP